MFLIMKKIMMFFVIMVITIATFTSCYTTSTAVVSSVEAVDDIYNNIDYTFIVTNGQPFYVDGRISYYFYNGIYYYPYICNGVSCLHPYRYVKPRGYVHVPPKCYRPDRRWMHRNERYHFHHRPNVSYHHRPSVQPNRGGSPRHNGSFHNGNRISQSKPNRSVNNTRSHTHVKTSHGNTGTFNRGSRR